MAIAVASISTYVYKYVIHRIAISYVARGAISPKIMEKRHSSLCRSTLYLYLYCIYFVLLYLPSICANKMRVRFIISFHLKTMTATTFNTYQVWECLMGMPSSFDHNMTSPNFKSSSIEPEKSTHHGESGSCVLAAWRHQNLWGIILKTRNKDAPGINLWMSYRGWVWHGSQDRLVVYSLCVHKGLCVHKPTCEGILTVCVHKRLFVHLPTFVRGYLTFDTIYKSLCVHKQNVLLIVSPYGLN